MIYGRDQDKRDCLDVKAAGEAQIHQYLLTKGLSDKEAQELIEQLRPKSEPNLVRYHRPNMNDKQLEKVPLSELFEDVKKDNLILAPTLTAYLGKHQAESFHSKLILRRLDWRVEIKQKSFDYDATGEKELATYNDLLQSAIKGGTNSITGIYGIDSTPLANKTAHSTLTSSTRIATNAANVAIERMLCRNLLFTHPDSARHYVLSLLDEFAHRKEVICTALEIGKLTKIHYSLVQEWLAELAQRYAYSLPQLVKLEELLKTLSPDQLSFIYYAGNLWNLATLNPEIFHKLFDQLVSPHQSYYVSEHQARDKIASCHDSVVNAATHLLMEQLVDKGNNHSLMSKEDVCAIADACRHLETTLLEAKPFLHPLLVVQTAAPNVAYTRQMLRECLVGGDTDSNLVTLMQLVAWHTGNAFPVVSNLKLAATIMIFVNMVAIDGALRQLAVNFGIKEEEVGAIQMKSELTPATIAMMGLTKTYFQYIAVKEKSVFKKPKLMVKGVALKSSNLPSFILKEAEQMMVDICATLVRGEKLSLKHFLQRVITVEQMITDSIYKGEVTFLRLLKINYSQTYKIKDPLKNNAGWADFYTPVVELPNTFLKLPTTLESKTKLHAWVESLDGDNKTRISHWLTARGKTSLPTIYVPEDRVQDGGIPDYIKPIIALDSILSDLCNIFYIILSSIGYWKPKDLTVTKDVGILDH